MKSKFLTLTLLTLTAVGAGEETKTVTAHLRFLSLSKPMPDVGIASPEGATEVRIPSDMLSKEVVYRGSRRLALVPIGPTETPIPSLPSEAKPKPPAFPRGSRQIKDAPVVKKKVNVIGAELASFMLPATDREAHYIMLVGLGEGTGMTAIDSNPGSFPRGSDRYVNRCRHPMVIEVPSGRYVIPQGATMVLRPGALDSQQYQLRLLVPGSFQETLVFSGFALHQEQVRKIRIIYPGEGETADIKMKTIADESWKDQIRRTAEPEVPRGAK